MKALPEIFSVYKPMGGFCGLLRAVGREPRIDSDSKCEERPLW